LGNYEKKKSKDGILMKGRALQISQLEIGYPQKKGAPTRVAGPIDIAMEPGELHCLLGPNGVGKSTLLRTLAGIQPALQGKVSIFSEDLLKVHKKKLSKMLSVVLTDRISYGNLTSYELISLGRTPYTGWFGQLNGRDKSRIDWAIENTHTQHLANKSIHELSDGERQKVMIARALAQDTAVILLDEPTAHLDLPNRIEIIRLLRKLARQTDRAIVMSTHELDLALQAADKVWLMTLDNQLFCGVPEDLVLQDIFGKVFTGEGVEFDKQHGVFKVVEPHCADINVLGDKVGSFWTKRALERLGYTVTSNNNAVDTISVSYEKSGWIWNYKRAAKTKTYNSIANLIDDLKTADRKV
jgi:iron complex transport system ATP-binding protein